MFVFMTLVAIFERSTRQNVEDLHLYSRSGEFYRSIDFMMWMND